MKTTFVLPLATSKDIYLGLNLLIPSVYHFFLLKDIQNFFIIIKKKEQKIFELYYKNLQKTLDISKLKIKIILEDDLLTNKSLSSYYIQMYLKLKIAEKIKTKQYITLDADIYFCKKSNSNNFFDKNQSFYKKINSKDKWGARAEKYMEVELSFQTNQTPFVFITSYVKQLLKKYNTYDLIINKKCSEYTLYLAFMIKHKYFKDNYQIKDFSYKPLTRATYKNNLKTPQDIIVESFILKENAVLNCIQSRINIHDNVVNILKKHIPSVSYNKLKIGLLTVVTNGDYYNLYEDAFFIKKNYCKYHNYDFIFDSIERNKYPKGKGWIKIYKLIEVLRNYDYVFLSDADVVITNRDIRIEDIIDRYKNDDTFMFVTTDFNSINSGNIIFKNCDTTFKFLKDLLDINDNPIRNSVDTYFKPFGVYEQPSIIYLLNTNKKYYDNCKIIPQFELNSYTDLFAILKQENILNEINHTKNRTNWKEGDFLIHFAGINKEKFNQLPILIEKHCWHYKKLIIQKENNDYGTIH